MRYPCLIAVVSVIALTAVPAEEPAGPLRPVHTYSIVARDPATGYMGVAVQSHWFSVGSLVTWGEAGVGVVATQSFVDPAYGPLGLELMRAGKSATETLRGLLAADDGRSVRQVAMIDRNGDVAAHTGTDCIQGAGHIVGDQFSVQANLMLDDTIWPAMDDAYRNAEGDLAERMLIALEAAESAGGDIRGKQSAAILIVRGESTGRPWADRVMELRVEDHPEPLVELRRLIRIHRAYDHMNAGDLAIEHGDEEAALREYAAAGAMFPDNLEMKYWHAVSLANLGRLDDAIALFRDVFAGDVRWKVLTPRLRGNGLLTVDDDGLKKILAAGDQASSVE